MDTSEILAIASFAVTIAGLIFVIGKNTQRLNFVENDLNNLGRKVESNLKDLQARQDKYEDTLNSQLQFTTLTAERLVNLKERLFDDEITISRKP